MAVALSWTEAVISPKRVRLSYKGLPDGRFQYPCLEQKPSLVLIESGCLYKGLPDGMFQYPYLEQKPSSAHKEAGCLYKGLPDDVFWFNSLNRTWKN
jgi:hypothetical protein